MSAPIEEIIRGIESITAEAQAVVQLINDGFADDVTDSLFDAVMLKKIAGETRHRRAYDRGTLRGRQRRRQRRKR